MHTTQTPASLGIIARQGEQIKVLLIRKQAQKFYLSLIDLSKAKSEIVAKVKQSLSASNHIALSQVRVTDTALEFIAGTNLIFSTIDVEKLGADNIFDLFDKWIQDDLVSEEQQQVFREASKAVNLYADEDDEYDEEDSSSLDMSIDFTPNYGIIYHYKGETMISPIVQDIRNGYALMGGYLMSPESVDKDFTKSVCVCELMYDYDDDYWTYNELAELPTMYDGKSCTSEFMINAYKEFDKQAIQFIDTVFAVTQHHTNTDMVLH